MRGSQCHDEILLNDQIKCYLCGSGETEHTFDYSGHDIYLEKLDIPDFVLSWYRCKHCSVLFGVNPSDIQRIYQDDGSYDALYDADSLKKRFDRIMALPQDLSDNWRRVHRISSFWNRYKKSLDQKQTGNFTLLDVGAGIGVFLARFIQVNDKFSVSALEINPLAASFLSLQLNVPTHCCELENLPMDSRYDLITFNRVLEHIIKPNQVLIDARERLSAGGIIYIEVPDAIAYQEDGSSNEAFASGHYMVYSPPAISHLLDVCGLELLELQQVREPSGKWTLFVFCRTAVKIDL